VIRKGLRLKLTWVTAAIGQVPVRAHNAFRRRVGVDEKTIRRFQEHGPIDSQSNHKAEVRMLAQNSVTQGARAAGFWQVHTGRTSFAKRLSNCQLKLACSNELAANCKLPEIDEEAWLAQPCGKLKVLREAR
jgi:hypothetical protein